MESLLNQYIENNHFGRLIGMHFELLNPGEVIYYLTINESHLATPMAAHGGCISALIDATMGVGALSLVAENFSVVSTLELKVSFLESIREGDKLIAKSIITRKGRKIIFVEAEVKNQNEKLVAKGSGTFIVLDGLKSGYNKD
jgi:uncharacterized protein (TIGR00369 family)